MSERFSVALVVLGAFVLFVAPMALFILHFKADAPFYFFAPDSFYYLGIALHSAHTPFFSNDAVHPTNGFHPLWEWIEFALSKVSFFNLRGPVILPHLFVFNTLLVGAATALFAGYVYRHTQRAWLSILATCPGLLWIFAGLGGPQYFNCWNYVNGMETGVELFFFALMVLAFGRRFAPNSSWRFYAGVLALGFVVLSRLDDIFFLIAVFAFTVLKSPAELRWRRVLSFAMPAAMILAFLLYNHHKVGIFLPISGSVKAGLWLFPNIADGWRALMGFSFWKLPFNLSAVLYTALYMRFMQLVLPIILCAAYLLWSRRHPEATSIVLQCLCTGALLKGLYNLLFVKLGYQGEWYFGVSIAVANLVIAVWTNGLLTRRANGAEITKSRAILKPIADFCCLAIFIFFSFNAVVSARSASYIREGDRDLYKDRAAIAAAITATGHPTFLEFHDGEISFATGLPSVAGFGLAGDTEAVKAQHEGRFFDLLQQRGVTIAASAGYYTLLMQRAHTSKSVYTTWGFNREEIRRYRFDPFWNDPKSSVVLYHIVPESTPPPPPFQPAKLTDAAP